MIIVNTKAEDTKEDEIYLNLSQQLLLQAKSEFKDCDTKDKLVAYLKDTIDAKEYYLTQKGIYQYQYAELERHTQATRAKAEEAKAMAEMLESIQRKVTHKIMNFSVAT